MTDSLRLLAGVEIGRVAFTRHALPTLRPVSHVVAGDEVLIDTFDPALAGWLDRQVIAYEADALDNHTRQGWCVILTGIAETITNHDEIATYQQLLPDRATRAGDQLIRLSPELITGVEYT
ncbi:pyridoxamine 5'-phosphate oxidase family protein [Nocardia sp. CA-128927]|uniref:pyridoxamine 5'-phosphate oxidase family protein n=1 Tax=Nocardia sp. CA-128927 TaxID=3239975 RepID=UPI003D9684F8